MYWLLLYNLSDDYLDRRGPLRPAHLALIQGAHDRGELLMAGAVSDPFDLAVLVFTVQDTAIIERFVADDVYVHEGLVTSWTIRPWNVVVGGAS
ncbi:MAG: uncharacterized protein JWL70_3049 [Acidimicrobiia bacterium]|nr:uncharacterized protein [Acidimicrobiia bacterium]